jgi:hypothetical protein
MPFVDLKVSCNTAFVHFKFNTICYMNQTCVSWKPLLNPDWNCLTMTRTHNCQKTNWAIRPATHFLFNNETVINHNIFPIILICVLKCLMFTEHSELNSGLYAVTGLEKLSAWPELEPVTHRIMYRGCSDWAILPLTHFLP